MLVPPLRSLRALKLRLQGLATAASFSAAPLGVHPLHDCHPLKLIASASSEDLVVKFDRFTMSWTSSAASFEGNLGKALVSEMATKNWGKA